MQQSSPGFSPQASSQRPFGPTTVLLGAGALILYGLSRRFLYGLSRRSRSGVAIATAGAVLALTSAWSPSDAQSTARASFLVNAPAERAYSIWRDFENLPRFMAHLKSVRVLDNDRSEWVASGPFGRELSWTAEMIEDTPNHRISWQALPDSDIHTSGYVDFRPDPQDRGTFITAEICYKVPAGRLGSGIATLIGKDPDFMVREDLRRFKALLEAGETPTTVGQTHGPRGIHGHIERVLFRETTNHPEPQAAQGLANATV